MWTNNQNSPEALDRKYGTDYSQYHAPLLDLTLKESRVVCAAMDDAKLWEKAERAMYDEAFRLAIQIATMRHDEENRKMLQGILDDHRAHHKDFRGTGLWYLGLAEHIIELRATYYRRYKQNKQ